MVARLRDPYLLASLAATVVLAVATTVAAYLTDPLLVIVAVTGLGLGALAFNHPKWTLYAAIFAIPLEQVTLPATGGLLTPAETLMVFLAGTWLISIVLAPRRLLGATAAIPLFAAFTAATLASWTFAVDPVAAGKVVLMTVVLLLVLHFIVTEGDAAMVRGIVAAVTVAAVSVSLFSIVGAGGSSKIYVGVEAVNRSAGVFQAPNTLATFLGVALPGAVILAFVGPRSQRLLGLAAVALVAVGLTSTLSRGGILAGGAAVVVLCCFGPFRNRALIASALVVLVLAAGVRPFGDVPFLDVASNRIASISDASAGDDPRVGIWKGAVEMIEDRPLMGVGPGSFQTAAPLFGLYYPLGSDALLVPPHAHDLLLNIFVERGLLAVLAFSGFLVVIGRHCLTALRERRGPDRAYAVAVTAALVAFLTQGLVDYTFSTNAIALTVIALAGCAVLLGRPA